MPYRLSDKWATGDMKRIKINFTGYVGNDSCIVFNILKKHYEIEISETPDFVFHYCFNKNPPEYDNCVKIFHIGEPFHPNFNECDYAIGIDYMDFGDRYIRIPFGYGQLTPSLQNRSRFADNLSNRKFCNFIYNNASIGEGALLRQEFCKKLSQYKHIDCPGPVLNNMTDAIESRFSGNWIQGKLEFLKDYKFTIAFENTLIPGYTTEKLIHPLISNSIPIYYGNPLVVKEFNTKAFVNCNDYDNDLDLVVQKVIELDKDENEYMEMLQQPPMRGDYRFDNEHKLETFLVNIIERGNKPYNKDPLNITHLHKRRSFAENVARKCKFYCEFLKRTVTSIHSKTE